MTWALLGLLALALAGLLYQTRRLGKAQDGEQLATKMYRDQVEVTKQRDEASAAKISDLESGVRVLVEQHTVTSKQLTEAKADLVRVKIQRNTATEKNARDLEEKTRDAKTGSVALVVDELRAGHQAMSGVPKDRAASADDRGADPVRPAADPADLP